MLLTSVCIFGEDTQAWMRVSRGPKPFFTEGPCEPTARLLSKRQSRCARALDRTLSLHRQGHALHLTAPHLRQCRPFPTGYLQLHKRARISKDQSLGFGKILTHGDAIHLANLVACKHFIGTVEAGPPTITSCTYTPPRCIVAGQAQFRRARSGEACGSPSAVA